MAKLTDVQASIAALKTQVETEHAEVKAAVGTISDEVKVPTE